MSLVPALNKYIHCSSECKHKRWRMVMTAYQMCFDKLYWNDWLLNWKYIQLQHHQQQQIILLHKLITYTIELYCTELYTQIIMWFISNIFGEIIGTYHFECAHSRVLQSETPTSLFSPPPIPFPGIVHTSLSRYISHFHSVDLQQTNSHSSLYTFYNINPCIAPTSP